MPYIPHTDADQEAMLAAVGVNSIDDLFQDVPARVRFPDLDLPEPLSEQEVMAEMRELAESNVETQHYACFLGAGAYNHYIPALVGQLLLRGEFLTAYTPYQPEISQGTLQVIFEYQSMIAALTGMEVANASHYDGATSLAEAAIMAVSHFRDKRRKVILSPAVHPHYRQVVQTYTQGMGLTITGEQDPTASAADLKALLDEQTALFVVQYPDFLGQITDLTGLAGAVHDAGALLCVVTNPTALGMLRPPGAFGADVVVGEAQPLGISLTFGGPYCGFFATRNAYVRRMAGRLAGETVDKNGRRGYVLTLTPREQHIRRDKATSNICTNSGLMMLAATMYLSAMGKCGLKQVAELCYQKAHYAAGLIDDLQDYEVLGERPFFHEFVVKCPAPVAEINRTLLDDWGIIGGYDLGQDYPHLQDHMLVAVTEMNSREEIEDLVEALESVGTQNVKRKT